MPQGVPEKRAAARSEGSSESGPADGEREIVRLTRNERASPRLGAKTFATGAFESPPCKGRGVELRVTLPFALGRFGGRAQGAADDEVAVTRDLHLEVESGRPQLGLDLLGAERGEQRVVEVAS